MRPTSASGARSGGRAGRRGASWRRVAGWRGMARAGGTCPAAAAGGSMPALRPSKPLVRPDQRQGGRNGGCPRMRAPGRSQLRRTPCRRRRGRRRRGRPSPFGRRREHRQQRSRRCPAARQRPGPTAAAAAAGPWPVTGSGRFVGCGPHAGADLCPATPHGRQATRRRRIRRHRARRRPVFRRYRPSRGAPCRRHHTLYTGHLGAHRAS